MGLQRIHLTLDNSLEWIRALYYVQKSIKLQNHRNLKINKLKLPMISQHQHEKVSKWRCLMCLAVSQQNRKSIKCWKDWSGLLILSEVYTTNKNNHQISISYGLLRRHVQMRHQRAHLLSQLFIHQFNFPMDKLLCQ